MKLKVQKYFNDFNRLGLRKCHSALTPFLSLAIRDEKTLIELDWLLEFRFSTSEILAARIGQTAMNINRFLKTLTQSKLIQSFSNSFASSRRLYMLTTNGVDFLASHGRDITHATTRQASLGKYTSITHNLYIQTIILKRLADCKAISLGRHLSPCQLIARPDALLLSKNNTKTALDCVYLKKPKDRVYDKLYQHAQAIKNGHYSRVEYRFLSPKDRLYYQTLFNKPEWPRFKHMSNSSKLKPYAKPFLVSELPGLKDAFMFECDQSPKNSISAGW